MSINIPCLLKTIACLSLLSGCAASTTGSYSRQDTDSKLAYCEQLRKQLDELKGKPQRRKAASDRYDLECRQQ